MIVVLLNHFPVMSTMAVRDSAISNVQKFSFLSYLSRRLFDDQTLLFLLHANGAEECSERLFAAALVPLAPVALVPLVEPSPGTFKPSHGDVSLSGPVQQVSSKRTTFFTPLLFYVHSTPSSGQTHAHKHGVMYFCEYTYTYVICTCECIRVNADLNVTYTSFTVTVSIFNCWCFF